MLDLRIVIALGFSLAIMGAISATLLSLPTKKGIEITAEESHLTAFKGKETSVVVRVESKGWRWTVSQVVSFALDQAEIIGTDSLEPGKTRIRFIGKFSGRSRRVRVRLQTADPLYLFQKPREIVCDGLELDILPISLLAPPILGRFPIIVQGELPAGSPGLGQELYGLEEYHTSSEVKDIVWRRVAESPEANLIARIRESNVKEAVRVGIIQAMNRERDRSIWMDLLCEGLASIGTEILQAGSSLTIIYRTGGELVKVDVSQLNELAEVLMSYSLTQPSIDISEVVMQSDLVITGLRELEDVRVVTMVAGKDVLLISEEANRPTLGVRSTIYSGKESLLPLVQRLTQ